MDIFGVHFEAKDMIAAAALMLGIVNLFFSIFQYIRRPYNQMIERTKDSVEDLLIELKRTEIFTTEYDEENWEQNFVKMDIIRNLSSICVPRLKKIDAPDEVRQSVDYFYENSRIMRRLYENYLGYIEALRLRSRRGTVPREKVADWPQLGAAEAILKAMQRDLALKTKILEDWHSS